MPAMLDTIKEVLHVHIVSDATKTPPLPKERVTIPKSYQSGPVPQLMLPHSPNRIRAEVYVQGVVGTNASVFLTSSNSDGDSVIAGQVNTPAAQIQPGFRMVILGTTEVWLTALAAQPPIVSVIEVIER